MIERDTYISRNFILVLLLMFLVGLLTKCASGPDTKISGEEIQALVPEFNVKLTNVYLTDLNPWYTRAMTRLWYWDTKALVEAQCNLLTGNIVYDRKLWNLATPTERRITLLHELGHCILWRIHKTGKLNLICDYSLMDVDSVTEACFLNHEEHYLKELLNPKDETLQTPYIEKEN